MFQRLVVYNTVFVLVCLACLYTEFIFLKRIQKRVLNTISKAKLVI
jgi:predicted nucleic-acid-binding Zn-ribbon protein